MCYKWDRVYVSLLPGGKNMNFREMDPNDVFALLDEVDEKGVKVHRDVLSGEVLKEEALFRSSTCPACGAAGPSPFVDPDKPFISGSLLPNKKLRCTVCAAEFDPHTRLITRVTPSTG